MTRFVTWFWDTLVTSTAFFESVMTPTSQNLKQTFDINEVWEIMKIWTVFKESKMKIDDTFKYWVIIQLQMTERYDIDGWRFIKCVLLKWFITMNDASRESYISKRVSVSFRCPWWQVLLFTDVFSDSDIHHFEGVILTVWKWRCNLSWRGHWDLWMMYQS